ncbi:unnamed protein product [Cylicocyclus nassatus]|uniref:Uncharacterized protein n=1 Tax=Cylicocyclus nassatus TaxID=53992 RepID=A0AA36M8V1_CYLNA|nr:unnamed protein product [Cylicocyclus nassatus]
MRFFTFALIFALFVYVAVAKPKGPSEATREARHSDKTPQKTRSSYVRFGKRANPNADLLYLDQLIL